MNKRLMLLFCLLAGFVPSYANAPDSTRITYKIPARVKVNNAFTNSDARPINVVNKSVLWDSLQSANIMLSQSNDSLFSLANDLQAELRSVETQLKQIAEENKNLNNELANANGDKLQSSHTNSILYIFNVILGIIMLIALVWMMGKKKMREVDRSADNGISINGSQEIYSGLPALDHRLERIEKLGNLRDKGLLTDEEFNFQKKQILAERT